MYIAVRPITLNSGEILPPGSPVPQAKDWSPRILRVHLDWHLVRKMTVDELAEFEKNENSEVVQPNNNKKKRNR